ncbi:MAG: hypothetical protein WED10_01280 [Brumimicrobium sp.]
MKKLKRSILYLSISFFILSCENENAEGDSSNISNEETKQVDSKKPNEQAEKESITAIEFSKEIADDLREQKFNNWATFTTDTVYFSPYAYIDTNKIKSLSLIEFNRLYDSGEVIEWGTFDGTGEPIMLDLAGYFERFVADFSLLSEENKILKDTIPARGNELNNVAEIFPDATIVEFHKPASEESGGMDWRSLMLVLVKKDGEWKLRAIVHNEWTT